ncbi:MAG: hypothetical protein MZV64_26385 [Ignavibacteriales bacterium]|nr:hypothetical protein [Ignavibacteriales bacterium]
MLIRQMSLAGLEIPRKNQQNKKEKKEKQFEDDLYSPTKGLSDDIIIEKSLWCFVKDFFLSLCELYA